MLKARLININKNNQDTFFLGFLLEVVFGIILPWTDGFRILQNQVTIINSRLAPKIFIRKYF